MADNNSSNGSPPSISGNASPPPTPPSPPPQPPPPKSSPPSSPSQSPPPSPSKSPPPSQSPPPQPKSSPPPPPTNSPPPPTTLPPPPSSPPPPSTPSTPPSPSNGASPPPSPSQQSPPPQPQSPPPPNDTSSPPTPPAPASNVPPATATPHGSVQNPPPVSPSGSLPKPRNTPSNSPSPPSSHGASENNTGKIVGLTLGGVVVLAVLALLLFLVFRRNKKRGNIYALPPPNKFHDSDGGADVRYYVEEQGVGNGSQDGFHSTQLTSPGTNPSDPISQPMGQILFSYEKVSEITDGFSSQNVIGEGGFGCVYKAFMPDGRIGAVKQLKVGGGQGEREFRAEVDIISRIHHRHLVSLIGYCICEQQRVLIYEFVPNGNLSHHMHGSGVPVLSWENRMKIAFGAARGLAYLHEGCNPKIIHRDIKSANILLDDDFEAQVADFGLARLTDDANTHVSTRVMGTFGYMAPEYATSGKLTDKSDVFSFGVVLLELITGRKPVDPTQPVGEESLVEWLPIIGPTCRIYEEELAFFYSPMTMRMTDRLDALEARMVTLETSICHSFVEFRQSMMAEFAKLNRGRSKKLPGSSGSENVGMEYRMTGKKVDLPPIEGSDSVGENAQLQTRASFPTNRAGDDESKRASEVEMELHGASVNRSSGNGGVCGWKGLREDHTYVRDKGGGGLGLNSDRIGPGSGLTQNSPKNSFGSVTTKGGPVRGSKFPTEARGGIPPSSNLIYLRQASTHPFEDLKDLKQGREVEDSITEFEYLSSQVGHLPEDQNLQGSLVPKSQVIPSQDVDTKLFGAPSVREDGAHETRNCKGDNGSKRIGYFGSTNQLGKKDEYGWSNFNPGPNRNSSQFGPVNSVRLAHSGAFTSTVSSAGTYTQGMGGTSTARQGLQNPAGRDGNFRSKGVCHIPYSELMDRKTRGLCFRCGEKFHLLHQCAEKQLRVVIIGDDEAINEDSEVIAIELKEDEEEDALECNTLGLEGWKSLFLFSASNQDLIQSCTMKKHFQYDGKENRKAVNASKEFYLRTRSDRFLWRGMLESKSHIAYLIVSGMV